METGTRDASKKGDHRGNGPDVGADDVGRTRAKGVSTIFYNSLRGDICPLILED